MKNAISTIAAKNYKVLRSFKTISLRSKIGDKPAFSKGKWFPIRSEDRFLSKQDWLPKSEQEEIKV